MVADAEALVAQNESPAQLEVQQHDTSAQDVPAGTNHQSLVELNLQRLESVSIGSDVEAPGRNEAGVAGVEVFVGGMSNNATEEELREAFASVGSILAVRVSRASKTGECRGYGYVHFSDREAAERACSLVVEVGGRPVGVHLTKDRPSPSSTPSEDVALVEDDADSSINRLLRLIRSHADKRAAVGAALRAVLALPSDKAPFADADEGVEGGLQTRSSSGRCSPSKRDKPVKEKEEKETEPVPDPATYLNSYPKCKQLINAFRLNSNTHNKTPLAILHEYATRLNLEVVYTESAESNLGPFNVEAKLTSLTGSILYASATGRGRGKKDAKQVAAAGVIEALLAVVPEADFLQPGKAKQRNTMAYSRAGLGAPGRGFVPAGPHSRGRRPRPPFGGGRSEFGGLNLGPGGMGVHGLDATFVPASSQNMRGGFGAELDVSGSKRDYSSMHRSGMQGGPYGLEAGLNTGAGMENGQMDPSFSLYSGAGLPAGHGSGLPQYGYDQYNLSGYQGGQYPQSGMAASGGGAGLHNGAGMNNAYSALAALQQLVQQQQSQQQLVGVPQDMGAPRPPYGHQYQPPTY